MKRHKQQRRNGEERQELSGIRFRIGQEGYTYIWYTRIYLSKSPKIFTNITLQKSKDAKIKDKQKRF